MKLHAFWRSLATDSKRTRLKYYRKALEAIQSNVK
jgi:hypothetical protein